MVLIFFYLFCFFFFNDTATTEIYTLSLHDALPISPTRVGRQPLGGYRVLRRALRQVTPTRPGGAPVGHAAHGGEAGGGGSPCPREHGTGLQAADGGRPASRREDAA